MRITKEKKQENYDRIIAIASELFRERGYDGVGVADLMERAGLTHGGFYNHFRSKEDLIAQATEKTFGEVSSRYTGQDVSDIVARYISRDHRDNHGQGCTAAALSCDAARQSAATRAVFADGIEDIIRRFAGDMAEGQASGGDIRAQAISVMAQAVGAIILSRACSDDSPLADEILDTCRENCLDAVGKRVRA